jgi:phosphatidylinositol glycan class Q protein
MSGEGKGPVTVVKLFVPRDLCILFPKQGEGVVALYGWSLPTTLKTTEHTYVIAGTTLEDDRTESLLRGYNDHLRDVSELSIIGRIPCSSSPGRHSERFHSIGEALKDVEFTYPPPLSRKDVHFHLISFDIPRPDKMRYLSLEPIILPLSEIPESQSEEASKPDVRDIQQERLERLVRLDPIRFADINHTFLPGYTSGHAFRRAIDCVNQITYVRQKMNGIAMARSVKTVKGGSILMGTYEWIIRSCRGLLQLSVRRKSACDVSACARQTHLRLGQLLVWPALSQQLRYSRLIDNEATGKIAPRYTALYNGVWLVANDLILGQAIGVLLCENSELIARPMQSYIDHTLASDVGQAIRWLDSWPLGVKLNTPLSRLFADMYTGMTDFWSAYGLAMVTGDADALVLSRMIYVVGIVTRIFGVSMLLCMAIDAARLVTLHLTIFYRIQRRIYSFFCSSTISLFHLFRGKKRNRLRGMRVDNATYELDQLLLGTLFFTLLIFLWLTVATYYAYFAALRFACVAFVAVLQAATATINHLPLFALMLRLKDPARLPGGVAIEVQWDRYANGAGQRPRRLEARLSNTPLSLGQIFRGQSRHLKELRSLPKLLLRVVTGQEF